MDAAYVELDSGAFRATRLTVGPWNPEHQHGGPPSALIAHAVERAAASEGLAHLARLTVNLIRPAPIGECRVQVATDYAGRNAGHYSGRLTAGGKECARFTALMQREDDLPIPQGAPGRPLPKAPKPPGQCLVDSGSGIGAALDFGEYSFVNCDLTLNLFRRPEGEWICLDSHSFIGAAGCGMAESALYDEQGMIGRATQSLAVRAR